MEPFACTLAVRFMNQEGSHSVKRQGTLIFDIVIWSPVHQTRLYSRLTSRNEESRNVVAQFASHYIPLCCYHANPHSTSNSVVVLVTSHHISQCCCHINFLITSHCVVVILSHFHCVVVILFPHTSAHTKTLYAVLGIRPNRCGWTVWTAWCGRQ